MKKTKNVLTILGIIIGILLIIFGLTGCSSFQTAQKENIQECQNNNGRVVIKYCDGNSNNICTVDCILDNEVNRYDS